MEASVKETPSAREHRESTGRLEAMKSPNQKNRSAALAEAVRIVTAPPLMALVLLLCLRGAGYFPGASLGLGILFLTVLPILAYPVWFLVPALHKGAFVAGRSQCGGAEASVPALSSGWRSSQRKLAIVFSVVGYIAGAAYCLLAHVGRMESIVFLTYLLSGAFIAVTSKAMKFNSSGHACGVAGPIAVLAYTRGPLWLLGLLVLAAVFWSSLLKKRHTLPQLLAGAASSPLAMCFWLLVM